MKNTSKNYMKNTANFFNEMKNNISMQKEKSFSSGMYNFSFPSRSLPKPTLLVFSTSNN